MALTGAELEGVVETAINSFGIWMVVIILIIVVAVIVRDALRLLLMKQVEPWRRKR